MTRWQTHRSIRSAGERVTGDTARLLPGGQTLWYTTRPALARHPRHRTARNRRRSRGASPRSTSSTLIAEPPDLALGSLAEPQLEHGPPGADVAAHDDLRLGGVGQHRPRGLPGHLAAMDPVLHPGVRSISRLHRGDVALLRLRHLPLPRRLQRRVALHRRRHDERRVRFVDVALRQLRVAEPCAVAHQFVRQRARDALDQHHVDGVLEDRAVALLAGCCRDTPPCSGRPGCAGSCSRADRRTPPVAHRRFPVSFH